MKKQKGVIFLTFLTIVSLLVIGFVVQPAVFAVSYGNDSSTSRLNQAEEKEEIILDSKYPVVSSYAGSYFSWDVDLTYKGGEEQRFFDLQVEVPSGFNYSISPSAGEGTEIRAIRLDPKRTYPESIKVTVRPYVWLVPEPGEYTVTVEASSEELKDSIELKAIVTAKYDLDLESTTGRLNTKATAGEDNYFSIVVTNSGSAELENVTFISKAKDRPSGWSVTFSPEKIDSLPVGSSREIEVNIKPAKRTISGDYMLPIEAEPESQTAWDNLEIRITVLTPTIWGWVGVGIVILVIVGLAVMFVRLGRR